ncbi:MAG: ABC transporter permease [Alphaproteobacteria bacterium]|jgi:putative ABC transport system permease protein|nr:ABC transporter permease [Alphaproteobacteria bacterium]MDP6815493.1 ABC transporter permease [Alphaproteobacteria bacterium]
MNIAAVLCGLAWKSLWSRRGTAFLTVVSLAIGVALVLGVDRLREEARASFANTVSGVDLIVGARSGPIALLLYSVFRIGNATNNISWAAYRRIAEHPDVAWAVPLSLGDSHRGYRVIGTERGYFQHYRFGKRERLAFAAGGPFEDLFDAVLGAEVAAALGYGLGDNIVIGHGLGAIEINKHDDRPFRVAGILRRTGTPVDRGVHVSLAGIEAMHIDWQDGRRQGGPSLSAERLRKLTLRPKALTAALIGLKSRFAVFTLQREINNDRREPLLAILPGVTLQALWDLMSNAELALAAIAIFVALAAFLGMLVMLLAGLGERRREIAILRAVGARPWQVFSLITLEAVVLTVLGLIVGLGLLYVGLVLARPVINDVYGIQIGVRGLSVRDLAYLVGFLAVGGLAGILPSYGAYRRSLVDGLIVRL